MQTLAGGSLFKAYAHSVRQRPRYLRLQRSRALLPPPNSGKVEKEHFQLISGTQFWGLVKLGSRMLSIAKGAAVGMWEGARNASNKNDEKKGRQL
jgi:hypothetical protein